MYVCGSSKLMYSIKKAVKEYIPDSLFDFSIYGLSVRAGCAILSGNTVECIHSREFCDVIEHILDSQQLVVFCQAIGSTH